VSEFFAQRITTSKVADVAKGRGLVVTILLGFYVVAMLAILLAAGRLPFSNWELIFSLFAAWPMILYSFFGVLNAQYQLGKKSKAE